jgi:diguanylate cyclase (GGDEF)-like protein
LVCLLLDLDHFKAINDTYGHQRGDKVLQEVARLLKSKRRSHDVVARYGGEEFILFLCQTPPEEALKIAERLRSDIESFPFSQEKGIPIKATVSIGIAAYPHPDIHDCQDMIKNADNALYAAKQAGRNKVIIETSLQNNLN